MRKLLLTLAALLVLTGSTFAQLVAQPAYGSTAIVPLAAVSITGAQFTPANSFCYRACGYKLWINGNPSNYARVVQVLPNSMLAFLPGGNYTVQTLHIAGPMVNATIDVGETVTAAPVLNGQGSWASDVNGTGAPIVNGVIPQPVNASVIQLALYGSDFGSITTWRLRISGNGVDLEALFTLVPFTQAHPTLVFGSIGRLASGQYSVNVSAFSDASIVSNAIQIVIP